MGQFCIVDQKRISIYWNNQEHIRAADYTELREHHEDAGVNKKMKRWCAQVDF